MRHGEFRCQKEATWVVTNMIAGGTADQIKALCQFDFLPPLCKLLTCEDPRFLASILDALLTLLASAKEQGYFRELSDVMEECGGLDTLEKLQDHENEKIYEKAYALIEEFFPLFAEVSH
jgi:hypothetical protein